ncbi:MAG: restriction endonuclease subunit S [Treponema sp.]|nr:restriction endonuclease subunit S [Treponema sp.]
MTVEMKKYKLNDVCLKITDGSHFSPKAVDFGYPMYSVKDMNEFGFNDSDYKMISEDDFKSLVAAGCRPQKDDVLIAKDGSYLKYAFVCKEEKDEVILSSIAILRPNKDIIDPTFFSFLLRNPSVKKSMKYYVSGTALPRIVLDNFKKMEINIPGLSEQKKIGDMLSTLDKRIENLRAQNRVLEQTAKTIYDYTFLQCAGHQTAYNKILNRNIPIDWEVKKMKEVCKVLLGGTPSTKRDDYWLNGTVNWLNSGEVAEFPIIDCEKRITKKAVEESSTVFLPKGSVTLSITRYLRPSILAIDACINQSVAGILENGILKKSYLFPMLKTEVPKLNALRGGAQQPHINKDIVENINVVIPPKDVLDKYYSVVNPIYEKILVNSEHLKELVNQRNTLLPLLMTGQIEV